MLYFPLIVSLLSLFFAYFLVQETRLLPLGQGRQVEVQKAIYQGVGAFLRRQYLLVGPWAVFLFFILWLALGFAAAIGFLLGVVFSDLAILVGFLVLGQAKTKAIKAAEDGQAGLFDFSLRSAAAVGFFSVGLGLLAISLCYFFSGGLKTLIGLAAGSSLVSLFVRLGKEVWSMAAERGAGDSEPAEIVEKISEDSNSLGLALDIFETYVLTGVAAVVLGSLLFFNSPLADLLPLLFMATVLLSSVISVIFIHFWKRRASVFRLLGGLFLSVLLSGLGFLVLIIKTNGAFDIPEWRLALTSLIGLFGAVFISLIFFRFGLRGEGKRDFSFWTKIESGFGLADLSDRMRLSIFLVFGWLSIILSGYLFAGVYGLCIAIVSAVSLSPLLLAFGFCFSIIGGASGVLKIADSKGKEKEVIEKLNRFSPAGNVVVHGFAVLGAGFAGVLLFFAYIQQLSRLGAKVQFLLEEPRILVGLFLGPLTAYCLFYLLIRSVEGAKPGAPNSVQGFFFSPAIFLVLTPIFVGFVLGPGTLAGLLIGSILVGIFLACLTGPVANPMIKVSGILALLLAAGFLAY